MTTKEAVAAGAVVLREQATRTEVLVVHRPHRQDWSLPKGHVEDGEPTCVGAVREVLEETGVSARLGARLDTVRYPLPPGRGRRGARTKVVHWWRADVVAETPHAPDDEVDLVEWWPVERALADLTWATDRGVLAQALALPPTETVVVLRHCHAIKRSTWTGTDDQRRPLTQKGRREARRLVDMLDAYGVTTLASSPAERTLASLRPYAERRGLTIAEAPALTEEAARDDLDAAASATEAALVEDRSAACGHRPVLDAMAAAVGVELATMLRKGEFVAVSRTRDGDSDDEPTAISVDRQRA